MSRMPRPSQARWRLPGARLPRRNALLGGTTTRQDVVAALRCLASPGSLADGPAMAAFERSFADRIGS
ncbi:MAG: hypothetical protein J2P30_23175, partial [Actinobacteria bacterium]|nr:hypothetical protein [Actinomycetota bacterium]